MHISKINRTAFSTLREHELATFAQSVVDNTDQEAAYSDVQSIVTTLKTQTETYDTALNLATNRGRDEVNAKNAAKETLLATLKKLATAMDHFADGNKAYLTEAGFVLKKKPEAFTGELLPPDNLQVQTNGLPGQLIVRCKLPQRSLTKVTALEWSVDEVHWNNGTYPSASRFVIKDLPRNSQVQVRVCAIGSAKRKSVWTDPVTASVV